MKKPFSLPGLNELSIDDRIELVETLWDTIIEVPEKILLTDEQKLFLDERLSQFEKAPHTGSSWEQVKNRILENN
jgi:putative addiction module component (TIGR02574 family)